MPSRTGPSLLLACFTVCDGGLAVWAVRGPDRRRLVLPSLPVPTRGSVEQAAVDAARSWFDRAPAWTGQLGAFLSDGLWLGVAAIVPMDLPVPPDGTWVSIGELTGLHATIARAGVSHLRERLDRDPIAFRLLATEFTLSELQGVYELLLERRLHKASFRRSLLAAHLVAPTDAWRSEGRGRPAQLFRYSPRRRRGGQRSARFELLG